MLINNNEYIHVFNDIKQQIKTAQYKAVLSVNQEQIMLFWNIGKTIIANTKYGTKFIDNLANDIKAEFPNMKGFSIRNLKYMQKFAELFPNNPKSAITACTFKLDTQPAYYGCSENETNNE